MKEENKILTHNLKALIILMIMPLLFTLQVNIGKFGLILAILSSFGILIQISINLLTGFAMLFYKDKLAPYYILSAIFITLIGFSLCGGWRVI
jgi:hypothetical protein